MDSIFGRKRSAQSARSRSSAQSNSSSTDLVSSSVPYDRLAPSGKAPVAGPSRLPTATALAAATASRLISPPNTNPTLTDDGPEFNYHALGKRMEANRSRTSTGTEPDERRDRVTSGSSSLRYQGPSVSIGINGEILPEQVPLPSSASPFTPNRRGSDAGSMRSISTTTSSIRPAVQADFAPYHVHRPTGSTRQSHSGQNFNYNSAYSASTYSVEFPNSASSASSSYPSFYPKPTEDFLFERPKSPSQINAMFEHLLRTRNIDSSSTVSPSKSTSNKISSRSSSSSLTPSRAAKDMQGISIETKWTLLKNDAQSQWHEQRRKQNDLAVRGTASALVSDRKSPEYFLKKFMDGSLTAEILIGMGVSIRTQPLHWCIAFVDLKGHIVLGNCLANYARRKNK